MQYNDPNATVTCTVCEEDAKVGDCSSSTKGELECPACGAPIEGASRAKDIPSKASDPDEVVVDEDGDARTRAEMNEKHNTPGPRPPTTKGPAFQPQMSEARAKAVLGIGHEAPPKSYCAECGSEWPIVNNAVWKNCGHTNDGVADPRQVSSYKPPAGTPRASIVGTTLIVTWGKSTFPTVVYGSFHVGPFSASVELMPGMNIVETAARIRADLKKIADDSFDDELAWYEEKLGKLSK